MASIRRRRLADGSGRWDVNYSCNNRVTSVTFDDPTEADEFARVVELRARRWPLRPLVERTGMTSRQLAEAHGITADHVGRLARNGLTDVQADRWATAAGFHPAQVWGWDWITAALPDDPEAEADGEAVA
jgi:hypothetical protein